MAKQLLSNVDAAWLHMEDPTNLMMINGFFLLRGAVDFERIRQTVEERLLIFDRFRQRVREPRLPWGQPYWEDDPHFDIQAHLRRMALPAPGDDEMLRQVVSDLASTPLDYSKPLWQFHVIEGYEKGALLFCRLHHCIADGIALMYVMLSICDEAPDASWSPPEILQKQRSQSGALSALFGPAARVVSATRKLRGVVWEEGPELLRDPEQAAEKVRDWANYSLSFSARLARLTLLSPDPKTLFKGPLGVTKRAAWSEPIDVQAVKQVGKAMGGTINDALMTVATGALRRYMLERGESPDGLDIRAMIPVNLRPPEEAFRLGNHFGLVVLALPIGIEDALERFITVKRRMDDLKNSPEAVVGFTILQAMGLSPTEIEKLGVQFFATKASMVLTNVPGPRKRLYFAGSPIDKLMFWVPQSGRMGLGISILSYAGEVTIGIITDAGLVPDPERIAAFVKDEFEHLQEQVAQIEKQRYQGEAPVTTPEERGQCKAMTQTGARCKNKALAGSAYCRVHAKMYG